MILTPEPDTDGVRSVIVVGLGVGRFVVRG